MIEGYGLSETSGATCATNTHDPVLGHVGGPLTSVKLRLRDIPEMQYFSTDTPYPRGELCMKGPPIFSGYYKRPDKTTEAFDKDGWFLSGDVV
jgi:long-chain acyl-CoA synthetase